MDTIYIPSRGRHRTMSTHKHFQRHGMENWFYVVEPFDYTNYVSALTEEGIPTPERHVLMFDVDTYKKPYHEFNNPKGFKYEDGQDWEEGLTTGPGPARNALNDFARERGELHYWMMDDDLLGFGVDAFYYQRNIYTKATKKKPANERLNIVQIFELYERLLDKYENLGLAEFEKHGMARNHTKNTHFSLSKAYSCIRINTQIEIHWRGRWNDDVILSLDYLWHGYVNLSSKIIAYQTPDTQSQAGGMTEGFIEEGASEELPEQAALKGAPPAEHLQKSKYRGTLAKAKITEELFPAVAQAIWKFGRPHHQVDYTRIEKELVLKGDTNLDDLFL